MNNNLICFKLCLVYESSKLFYALLAIYYDNQNNSLKSIENEESIGF